MRGTPSARHYPTGEFPLHSADAWIAAGVLALAAWLLASGLDDMLINAGWLAHWIRERSRPAEAETPARAPRPAAILVPLWREAKVIRGMVEHNLAAIRYAQADFFIGVYPNDAATLAAVRDLAARFPRVHVAVCPHPGPTSKADCLNWIYQHVCLYEEQEGVHFDLILTHDAEDLIHPESLRRINNVDGRYGMIQLAVLPLPTPPGELVHGVYCDEFAEFQLKELPARVYLGGFLPSCGVGTAFTRPALDALAEAYANHIFEPQCLTEDYENGFRVRRLGFDQIFLPIYPPGARAPLATRGYFPRLFKAAIRQRTRWMMGIGLQSWELHGWRETLKNGYWFWRDRKGVIGSMLTPLANAVFLQALAFPRASAFQIAVSRYPWLAGVCWLTLAIQCVQVSIRMACSSRIYGWRFGLLAPVRIPVSNAINCIASVLALQRFAAAKWRGEPLVWLKTEHAYPSRAALMQHRRPVGEILTGCGYVSERDLTAALASQPTGVRIGELLVRGGKLSEERLYHALSIQQNLDMESRDGIDVRPQATRALPAEVSRRWKVLPFRVSSGQLYLTGPELPTEQMYAEIARFSSLEIRFHLITPGDYAALVREHLHG